MAELIVNRRTLGELGTNCYFLSNSETKETLIVDPADNMPAIMTQIQTKGYKPAAVLLTHGHFDHILAADELRRKYNIKIYIMEEDRSLAADSYENLSARFIGPYLLKTDVDMKDGDVYDFNGFSFRVIHTPGHTKGSCCFYFEKEHILISGDTLFRFSVGRTDFPTGDTSMLYRSIAEKLLVLPKETIVYPGHGDETDIAEAKEFFAQYGY
jgi:glyoxylase-like metal-dependent hydrolase (beta-lactamase superfamily II)